MQPDLRKAHQHDIYTPLRGMAYFTFFNRHTLSSDTKQCNQYLVSKKLFWQKPVVVIWWKMVKFRERDGCSTWISLHSITDIMLTTAICDWKILSTICESCRDLKRTDIVLFCAIYSHNFRLSADIKPNFSKASFKVTTTILEHYNQLKWRHLIKCIHSQENNTFSL